MSNEELATLIQDGHTELLTVLWDNTYKLLTILITRQYKSCANRLKVAGAELDDFLQEGYFALTDAVKAYKRDNGVMFNSYLNYSVRNRLRTLIGNTSDAALRSISLDEPVSDEDSETTRLDLLADTDTNIEDDIAENDYIRQLHNDLEVCLQRLQPFERDIIKARYYNGHSLSSIAEEHNVTVQEISKVYKSGMRRLRDGKTQRQLRAYRDAVVSQYAYNGSFMAWREKQMSSTEFTVMKLAALKTDPAWVDIVKAHKKEGM